MKPFKRDSLRNPQPMREREIEEKSEEELTCHTLNTITKDVSREGESIYSHQEM